MPSSAAYREKAKNCIAQANAVKDPQQRAVMFAIAKGYLDMADYVGGRHHCVDDIVWLIATPEFRRDDLCGSA